jgi:hypothetical protein
MFLFRTINFGMDNEELVQSYSALRRLVLVVQKSPKLLVALVSCGPDSDRFAPARQNTSRNVHLGELIGRVITWFIERMDEH